MKLKNSFLRSLPAVDLLMQEESLKKLSGDLPRKIILKAAQETVELYRKKIMESSSSEDLQKINTDPKILAAQSAALAKKSYDSSLKYVINATGTILHTNLGRAPLASSAVRAVSDVSANYSNLELSLDTGQRGSRMDHVMDLICELTGAEAAMVVNNNAAAVFMVLNTLAKGGEVIVSRGQLVEIGGSFRIPDVMAASGARLIEVGTTNKCYLSDYEKAVSEDTALLLKVHTSNYRILGFTKEVNRKELVALGKQTGIPVMEDLGSGTLFDLTPYGLPPEPRVQDCLSEGMQLVTFSGDKLLGGPQCGIIAGEKSLIKRCRNNQILRALRVDKYTVAALEATLKIYLKEEEALKEIPVLNMLTRDAESLQRQAKLLLRRLKNKQVKGDLEVVKENSAVGGGAFPTAEMPTYAVSFKPEDISVDKLAKELRSGNPPLIVRVNQDRILFDVRTLLPGQEPAVVEALTEAMESGIKESR